MIRLRTIAPNPTQDAVTLQNIDPGLGANIRVRFINTAGTMVHTRIIEAANGLNDKNLTLNISHLPPGVYIVIINTEKQVRTKRLVKN